MIEQLPHAYIYYSCSIFTIVPSLTWRGILHDNPTSLSFCIRDIFSYSHNFNICFLPSVTQLCETPYKCNNWAIYLPLKHVDQKS